MVIKAVVKLQRCRTSSRHAFVDRNRQEHGIARGPVERYEVTGESWAHIRRILRNFDVMGHSIVRPETVESYTKDCGHAYGRLALMHPADLIREVE